jgi:hypothetical protein
MYQFLSPALSHLRIRTDYAFFLECKTVHRDQKLNNPSAVKRLHKHSYQSVYQTNDFPVVGLEQGPLSLMNTTEELLERKSSGSSLEI